MTRREIWKIVNKFTLQFLAYIIPRKNTIILTYLFYPRENYSARAAPAYKY